MPTLRKAASMRAEALNSALAKLGRQTKQYQEQKSKVRELTGEVRELFCGQVVQVLIHGIPRVDFVTNTIQPGHQHSRESKVWVSCCIWKAHFNTLTIGAGHKWYTAGG